MIIVFSMSVFGAYYVTDPNNCPVSYQSQTCSGSDVVCGASGGITFCSLPSSITAPTSAGSTSTSNYACSDTACDGGFVIDCYGYDGASPFCDTSLCDRESTCYNKHVQTICTANLYVDSSCSASCISGYVACDGSSGDADGCEVHYNYDSCSAGANNNINSGCTCVCDSNYLDCDGSGAGVGTGCEVHDGGACTVGVLAGTYDGCTCTVDKSYFETGTDTAYSTTDSLLWGSQYGTGWLMNLSQIGGTDVNFGIDNSGCIMFDDGTTQCTAPVSTPSAWTNSSTTISTDLNVNVNGAEISTGTYAINDFIVLSTGTVGGINIQTGTASFNSVLFTNGTDLSDVDNIMGGLLLQGEDISIQSPGLSTPNIKLDKSEDTISITGYTGITKSLWIGSDVLSTAEIQLNDSGNAYFKETIDAAEFTESGSTTLTNSINGNAATATALAANPTNCAAGSYPLGVAANGNVESCTVAGGSTDYASIYRTFGSDYSQTMGGGLSYSQIIGFNNNGTYSGAIPDDTNDHITISTAGDYHITSSMSVQSSKATNEFYFIMKNNGATRLSYGFQNFDAIATMQSLNINIIRTLEVGDTVELWFRTFTGGEKLRFSGIELNVIQVG